MSSVELIEIGKRKAIVKSDCVGMFQLAKVMGPAYEEVQAFMESNDLDCVEAPFTSYQVDDWEKTTSMGFFGMLVSMFTKKWDIEMGFVLSEANSANAPELPEDMEYIEIPEGKWMQTMHIGPYQNVGNTYKKIYAHALAKGLTLDNASYEFYLNDPRKVEKEQLETRIEVKIKD